MSGHVKYADMPNAKSSDWANIKSLMPYIWEYKGRVLMAMVCLILAKVANVGVPIVLKDIVDSLDPNISEVIVFPLMLLMAYGALRIVSSLFNEMRDVIFTRVRYRAMRRITIRTMDHLHNLSLRFHLERKTGAVSRDLQRGATSLSSLLNYFTFSIIPVIVEFLLVAMFLLSAYDFIFSIVIFSCVGIKFAIF